MSPSLSLIYLAFDEEANLPVTIQEGLEFCNQELEDWEIIIVNDGSRDNTGAVADGLAESDSKIRVFHHAQNGGMGAGMHTGIKAAQKEHLVFLPSDGQVSPFELPRLFAKMPMADIVVTTYDSERETWAREWISRSFRVYMRVIAGIRFQLQGLYIFPTSLAQEIEPKVKSESFFFSFELIQRAMEDGARVAHTTMSVKPRLSGSSKVTGFTRIKKVAAEVLRYRGRRIIE